MSGKTDKGFRWMKYIMWLWLAFAGFKALFGLFGEDPGKSIAEAIALVTGGFVMTGIPAFLLGWLTGSNDEHRPYVEGTLPEKILPEALEPPPVKISVASPVDQGELSVTKTTEGQAVMPAPKVARPKPIDLAELAKEDAAYEQALNEVESNTMEKALWARAFSEANGDENRAKAQYIKRRVSQMLS